MRKIIVNPLPNAEDNAMLQALYSRSANSVEDHLKKLESVGSGGFMSKYYIGYGHASIADCGFTTIYVEGVSMLAAKAIQDNALYNGQECSSRYIDWSNQPFFDPVKSEASTKLMEAYREFYTTQKPILMEALIEYHPPEDQQIAPTNQYYKTIEALAFDILRGYLPSGATTNLSWTTSLRKANDQLDWMALHPLQEVREIAAEIHAELLVKYPDSIHAALPVYDPKSTNENLKYRQQLKHYYNEEYGFEHPYTYEDSIKVDLQVDLNAGVLCSLGFRPKYAPIPRHLEFSVGQTQVTGHLKIDYGSYRDLQRHRGGYLSVPIVSFNEGMNPWYVEMLAEIAPTVHSAAMDLVDEVHHFISVGVHHSIGEDYISSIDCQYFVPMGANQIVKFSYSLAHAIYIAELRSGQTVHATLRPFAQALGIALENVGIKTYCDFSETKLDIRRGKQDITEKQ